MQLLCWTRAALVLITKLHAEDVYAKTFLLKTPINLLIGVIRIHPWR
jgi:hypothetical protein